MDTENNTNSKTKLFVGNLNYKVYNTLFTIFLDQQR